MTWEDLSELHLASLATEDDTLFDRVLDGKIAEAIWKIDTRRNASRSSRSPGEPGLDGCVDESVLASFGVERFSDMGDPVPPAYLVHNCIEKAHPTYIYGSRGTLKSLTSLAWGIAIASPEVSSILGYAVKDHGPVVLFDSELNSNVFKSRAVALCNGLGIPKPEDLYYMNAVGVHPSQSFPKLHEFCEIIKAKAAIIDSFGFAVRGDPESYKDVRNNSTEYVDPLIAKGIAVVLVEHKPHQGNHIFGSVAKEYHGRYIFQVKDLDGETRAKGERNTQLVNEKASFTDEGQKITLLTKFGDDKVTIEPQGTTDEYTKTEDTSTVNAEVKVRRSLEVSNKTTDELAADTGLNAKYLANDILPHMRARQAIYVVDRRGRGKAFVWGLTPPAHPSSPAIYRDLEAAGRVVADAQGLDKLISDLDSATTIALDLETMPPAGWRREVARTCRSWWKKLKKRPTRERMRNKWEDTKEKVYEEYATNPTTAQVRLVSLATHEGLNKVVDVTKVDSTPLLAAFQGKTLITHNGAFDLGVLRERYGYVHDGRILDTQLMYGIHHYAEAGKRDQLRDGMRRLPDPRDTKIDLYGIGKKTVGMTALAAVVKQYLGILIDKGSQASDWSVPKLSGDQLGYALMDTEILLDLSDELVSRLTNIGMADIVKLESRTFPALVDMSLNGFPASREMALAMAEKYRTESEAALDKVHQLLPQGKASDGTEWRWSKDTHIREVLKLLGANMDKKTYPKTEKTGEPSTAGAALKTITKPEKARQWVEAYLAYKDLYKRHNDFASRYAGLIQDGVIKGSFDTVSTGRLSCRKPNLQQVPKRGKLQTQEGMRIRDIFRPREKDSFIVADFAQVELLLAATIAQRETGMRGHMLEVFQNSEYDIHTVTAATISGKPEAEVTKGARDKAKAVNFGLIYGAEAETLLEYCQHNYGIEDMTLQDAKAYRQAFFERYPELTAWHRQVESRCNQGYEHSTTPLGRRRKLPKWASSGSIAHTTAKNAPVQGAGADAIKLTLAKLFEDRHNCPGNPRLNCCIHDEVVLSVAEEHKDEAVDWITKHMAAAEREAVGDPESPIVVDVKARESW